MTVAVCNILVTRMSRICKKCVTALSPLRFAGKIDYFLLRFDFATPAAI